jgi:hypothetical protein
MEIQDINWVLEIVEDLQKNINVLTYKVNLVEKILNIHSQDKKTIVKLLEDLDADVEGTQKYVSNLSKDILNQSISKSNGTKKDVI